MIIYGRTTSILKANTSGLFTGLAWAFDSTPDQQGDVILPTAFADIALPLPVLVEHEGEPVGEILSADVSPRGLEVQGLLDANNPAYERARSGELGGLSVGFNGAYEQSGPLRIFKSAALFEVSVCRTPVNTGSRIGALKSWQTLADQNDLEKRLRAIGAPHRLASKIAASAWPAIQSDTDTPPELLAALRRFANH